MTTAPDIFRNVHKGIRKALGEACLALGRAGDDPQRTAEARSLLRSALRFVAHHGENEDLLLLPLLESRAPDVLHALSEAHRSLHRALAELSRLDEQGAPSELLYAQSCAFTAAYLEHMHQEEQLYEPTLRAVLSSDELLGIGRKSVERTAPADQRMMLGFMLPAMPAQEAELFLGRLPAGLAQELRALLAWETLAPV